MSQVVSPGDLIRNRQHDHCDECENEAPTEYSVSNLSLFCSPVKSPCLSSLAPLSQPSSLTSSQPKLLSQSTFSQLPRLEIFEEALLQDEPSKESRKSIMRVGVMDSSPSQPDTENPTPIPSKKIKKTASNAKSAYNYRMKQKAIRDEMEKQLEIQTTRNRELRSQFESGLMSYRELLSLMRFSLTTTWLPNLALVAREQRDKVRLLAPDRNDIWSDFAIFDSSPKSQISQ